MSRLARRSQSSALALLLAAAPFVGSCAHIDLSGAGRELGRAAADVAGNIDTEGVRRIGHAFGNLAGAIREANQYMTPEQEYFLGRTVTATLLADYGNNLVGVRGKGRDARPGRGVAYLQTIAQVILEGARRTAGPEERLPVALRVALVESTSPNAFAAPGGFVVVTTGMLELAQTEDEIAAVLAHEASHVILGHGLGAIKKGRIKEAGESVGRSVGEALGSKQLADLAGTMGGMAGDVVGGLKSGYPQDWEYQADARAQKTLRVSGYEPAALAQVLERLGAHSGAAATGHAKTHPPPQERVGALGDAPAPEFRGEPLDPDALAGARQIRQKRYEAAVRALVATAR